MYGILVIAYLFLGGAAGGTFLVMSLWSLFLHGCYPFRTGRVRQAFRALRSAVYTTATVVLVVALACLLWDLDYPHRALLVFALARPTPLTFGACSLAIEFALGVLLTLANLFHLRFLGGRAKRVLEVLCVPASIAVMGYTGFFLYSNIGVPLWHTWTLIGLFLLSATSSGLSVVMLIDYFAQGQTRLLGAVRPLQRCHLACLAAELAFMAAFVASAWHNPQAAPSLATLTSPNVLPTAVVGALGLGIVVPFLLESYALLRKEHRAIPVSDFVCLIGAFCLRWSVIVCGVHY